MNAGSTLVIIEHNLGIIKSADWIIDLGLEGGAAGGQIVAEGRLEQVAKVAAAYTGRFLEMRSSRNLSAHEARRTQRSPLPRCDG